MARIDTDLLGLPIVALDSALVVGEIDGLLIDDATRRVVGFLVDLGLYECSALRYDAARAVGRDAVIVDDAAAVTDISADPLLEALALKDVAVSESRVLTRSGRTVGTIGDFYLRAETGDIVGIEVLLGDQTASDPDIALIPIGAVHRLGVDLVVLEDDFLERAVADDAFDDPIQTRTDGAPPQAGTGPAAPVESDHPVETTQGSEPAAGSSSPAHAHFLEGKRALRRIEGPSGEVIAEAGELVTIEMIQKAKRADQLLILSLNVE